MKDIEMITNEIYKARVKSNKANVYKELLEKLQCDYRAWGCRYEEDDSWTPIPREELSEYDKVMVDAIIEVIAEVISIIK